MDKYEYRVKTEQMLEYMNARSYRQAMEIAEELDWKKIKNVPLLCTVSEIYEYNKEYQKSRDVLFIAYDRAPESRKIIYRLGTLALKLGDLKEAKDCYQEFMEIAPKDPNGLIFQYKLLQYQNASLEEQIAVLEEFKKVEYVEKWAYELAKLYHQAGRLSECLEECDDLILWFSEGRYVRMAMEMKMQYKPLTPLQQEKYEQCRQGEEEQKPKQEEPVVEESPEATEAVEESVQEETVVEETAEPVAAVQEAVVEEPVVQEETEEVVIEEEQEADLEEEKNQQASGLSIEELLKGWEEIQKENAQIIMAEHERVQMEKEQTESEEAQSEEAQEEILPEDVKSLMEELEAESAEIKAKKAAGNEPEEVEKKNLFEKVAATLGVMENKEEILPEDWAEGSTQEEAQVLEEPAEEATQETVAHPTLRIDVEAVSDMLLQNALKAGNLAEEPQKEIAQEATVNEVTDKIEEIPEPVQVDEGIKFGDTQAIAISAKSLRNDTIVEIPEESKPVRKPSSKYDTGFIVQGRYDLEAQSEVGTKAGLTEEQKKLFSYFVPVRGVSEQIAEVLNNEEKYKARYGTSRIGNLMIVGRRGAGKTVLAVNFVKAIQKSRNLKQGKVGIVTAESLNKKDMAVIMEKLNGGALIVERASKMNRKTVTRLCEYMEGQTGEMLVILEDERKPLDKMLAVHPNFKKKFTSRVELPVFISDELVTFGQTYAKENGYKIDDMGILALYTCIDVLQREESVVTVADVKIIIDRAIENSKKVDLKNFMKKIFGKKSDEGNRVLLTEKDFQD